MSSALSFFSDQDVSREKWEQLLSKNKFASVFQSPSFFDLYNSVNNYSASVFALELDNNYEAICVVTFQKENGLKGYFSRRAIVYGGPLINSPHNLPVFLNFINKEVKQKAIYIEIRNSFDYSEFKNEYLNNQWKYLPYMNLELDLTKGTVEELIGKMKYNRKREIRISLEERATYGEAKDLLEVKALYSILEELYKTRVKLPLPEMEYFERLFLSSIGKVIIVKHDNMIIGGSFCLFMPGNILYTLYYCGRRDYHKKIFPTHLAIIGAADVAQRNHVKMLDFMGAGKKGEEYGVRKYKEEFGGELVENGRFIKINNKVLYKLGVFALSIIQKVKK